MKSHISLVIVVLAVFVSGAFAELGVSAAASPVPADANAVNVPAFPYVGLIVGDNVHVRSGPGTNYYNCGKLDSGEKVKVVSRQFSWSCIVPPAGSFSWIYKPYVSLDPDNPGTGIVRGDNVRVYAGSDVVVPIHSTLQLKLDRGEKVKLMGEEKDNYYKITPPTGAYLWVSTAFTKPSVPEVKPVVRIIKIVEPNEPNDVKVVAPLPPKISIEAEKLKEYKALLKKLQAERDKPLERQNYASLRKALEAIAKNKEAGRVVRYCELAIKQIDRCELVFAVSKKLDLQNKRLEEIRAGIEKARRTRLAKTKKLGRFAVIGKLKASTIYGTEAELKYYRIIDASGKTICYARPVAAAVQTDLSKLIDHKVGLIGTIAPHPQTAGALVRFTEAVELK